ncbi:CBS domain-containing protein [Fluoribacter dumoffii]|uniref:Putative manganese-dependent inorganic pyrophosphatase n=1 Tax=Fluoribacter dumoffii TaxID=463 RepID=A0A377G8S6_9GAMM|nr:CBS domain-containing protein [Fluoribacter dumoffii]KTC89798.1 inosine 5'-monophosphate dehydrogenase [Fluoribacter dumoffii NY 23]MCW8385094.1 CBS domain-containing protein [Fluoribacter dumoffii]MCW8418150.1 CBS domain-containing protein [Fluoribacter dumoffii]MCW8454008.1 CBS domain-containing protein [Fluoribacter dumoffii]MCW8461921.1 CBS domain-containing protein [Fluoribacter dumoffii]
MAFIEAFVEEIVPVAQQRLVTIRNDAPLLEAAKFLDGRHINLVVVCDKGGAMVGIITRTDVVRMMAICQGCNCTVPVASVMTKEVVYCLPTYRLRDVWMTMKEQNLLHVPIVDEKFKPIGVINARDALLVLMEKAEIESSLLRDYIMNVGYR